MRSLCAAGVAGSVSASVILMVVPTLGAAQPAAVSAAPSVSADAIVQRDADGRITVRATRAVEPLRIDGRIDEAIYAATEAITGFVQQEPDETQPATERTDAWVFFDEDYVYVSARCWESRPERRVANEMRRDTNQLRQNDTFLVLLDTFHDRRNGYIFYANPIGGLADSQVTDEGAPNTDWNTVWNVRTSTFEGGWIDRDGDSLQVPPLPAGPRADLGHQPAARRPLEERVVVPRAGAARADDVPRNHQGVVSGDAGRAGGAVGHRNIELKPYALGGVATDNTATPRQQNDGTLRAGADVKYGLTPNLTADLTVNTDFAQVEVDEQQVNLTRFNLFFPEKRDFFLEGLGIFAFAGRASAGLAAGSGDTPYLFFSRRIGLDGGREMPLRAGGRLTGKVAGVTLGVLNVQTGNNDATALEESSNFTVIRGKRDILRRSSIGGMFTHRSATPGVVGSNDGYGVDATFLVLPERPHRHLPRRHAERRQARRQPELSRLLRLQRRSLRPPGGPSRRGAELPAGGRIPAANEHAPQLRARRASARARRRFPTCAS